MSDGSDSLELTNTIDKTKVREKESVHFAFPFQVPGGTLRFDLAEALVVPETSQLAGSCKDFIAAHAADVSGENSGVTLTSLDAPLFEIGAMTDETPGPKDVRVFRETAAPGTTVYSYAMNNYWHTNYKADQEGVVSFRYGLRPHARGSQDAIARAGLEAARPLVAIRTDAAAPPLRPPFTVEPSGVLVRSLAPSEDGKAIVVRLYNASAAPQRARLLRGESSWEGTSLADASGEAVGSIRWPLELPPFGTVLVRLPMSAR